MPVSPLKLVREFFGMSLAEMKAEWGSLPEMKAEWKTLTPKDKAEIVAGLTDGTLTY